MEISISTNSVVGPLKMDISSHLGRHITDIRPWITSSLSFSLLLDFQSGPVMQVIEAESVSCWVQAGRIIFI